MLVDAHLHCTGRESTDDVLRTLDGAGVEVGVLLAPFLSEGYSMHDAASLRRANTHLSALTRRHRDRLAGLAMINPALPGAVDDATRALDELALDGFKMVPSGWHPEDDCAQAVFAVAASRRAPILFHSGIFIDGVSSRFCRPADYEPVRAKPGTKVTLAHLGWPWCDEAIAVGLIDRINGVPPDACQFRFDLSFGAPPVYREAVLRNALAVLGPELLQYGSDCFLPCPAGQLLERHAALVSVLDALDVDAAGRARIFAGTACAWLGRAPAPAQPASQMRRPAPRAGHAAGAQA
jgi:predicted TIM-barrel fold metal-dependent hydrolase